MIIWLDNCSLLGGITVSLPAHCNGINAGGYGLDVSFFTVTTTLLFSVVSRSLYSNFVSAGYTEP